jgi:hypothetical protein
LTLRVESCRGSPARGWWWDEPAPWVRSAMRPASWQERTESGRTGGEEGEALACPCWQCLTNFPNLVHHSPQLREGSRWENSCMLSAISAARLTQRVPWLCVPLSRGVCLFGVLPETLTIHTATFWHPFHNQTWPSGCRGTNSSPNLRHQMHIFVMPLTRRGRRAALPWVHYGPRGLPLWPAQTRNMLMRCLH